MALRIDYVTREVGQNLVRNVTLTVASVITVFVSLSLVGVAFVVRDGVQNATARWANDVEFIVFMNPEAPQDQLDAVREELDQSPQVEEVTFVDQQEAYEEFQDMFADSPDMLQTVEPEILPPSFRVTPVDPNADAVQAFGDTFRSTPGVRTVAFAQDAVKDIQNFTSIISTGLLIGALFLLGAAILLILNTIRTAMFARRREIEVMKLVGATNWFIRIPFMIEGLIQSLIGAAGAVGAIYLVGNYLSDRAARGDLALFLGSFTVKSGEMFTTSIMVLVLGVVVAAVGAGVAVTRFLDV